MAAPHQEVARQEDGDRVAGDAEQAVAYQAQTEVGVVAEGFPQAGTTYLGGQDWPGVFQSYNKGILYVEVNREWEIRKAVLKGSTAHFVALLEDKPINAMGIPVIVELNFPGWHNFYINVNEAGKIWLEPPGGGVADEYLRSFGGGQESQGPGGVHGVRTSYRGGDPLLGARYLWRGPIGSQLVKGILEPDK